MADVKPALTDREWRDGVYESSDLRVARRGAALDGSPRLDIEAKASPIGSGVLGDPRDLHATAAFCLDGQPFGFTRKDVERHREQAEHRRRLAVEDADWARAHHEYADWHDSMANRIAAMLPPEE